MQVKTICLYCGLVVGNTAQRKKYISVTLTVTARKFHACSSCGELISGEVGTIPVTYFGGLLWFYDTQLETGLLFLRLVMCGKMTNA